MGSSKKIELDYLARVEGEGTLYLEIEDDKVQVARLKIFEPPRFFEGLLKDRHFTDAADITSRICGICPVAYQMSAVHAMEYLSKDSVNGPLRELRRLLYCGEWIESHALHIFMLHAPDFLGYPDVITMAKDHRDMVVKGLQMKKTGNQIVDILGGREIHPVNVRVGGFYRVPEKREFRELVENLKEAHNIAIETCRWLSTFEYPDFIRDYTFVALRHESEYPFNEGRIISNKGLDISVEEYEDHFEEEHISHSTALHSILDKKTEYFTGPLARYNLNFDRLPSNIKKLAFEIGLGDSCKNPFRSIQVRAIETLYAIQEALRILEEFEHPGYDYQEVNPGPGKGYGCTEAPRGILYHRYELNDKGEIMNAKIVAPTSQNQKIIEDDLRKIAEKFIHLDDQELTEICEQTVRNYDPCISCSTHFLKLEVNRK